MTNRETAKQGAITRLRDMLQPGDRVYTILKHVSRSGMQRSIDVYLLRDPYPIWISRAVALATDSRFDDQRNCAKVDGCGMDMGFALVYDLSRVLFPTGFKAPKPGRNGDMSGWDKDGGYALKQEWL